MPLATPGPRAWKRWARRAGWVAFFGAALLTGYLLFVFRDRNPGYTLALDLSPAPSHQQPKPLQAGFGRANISPDISNPARPVYVAGFSQNRIATRIHDDLWAIALVLDDGHRRLAIVTLDAIGFFHDDVLDVRRRIPAKWKIDYTVVCSTHNHSTPDLMGLWGPHPLRSGVDRPYRQKVIDSSVAALEQAVQSLRPVQLRLHEVPTPPDGLLTDTRKPQVYDADIRAMQFLDPDSQRTLGTLVSWANHPETPWSRNTEITADFPGVLRDCLERGVTENGQQLVPGLGGTHLFVNGAVGGLMTTHPSVTVQDPYTGLDHKEPSHTKTLALGRQLFSRLIPHLLTNPAPSTAHAPIGIRARTVLLPLQNPAFLAAPALRLIDRGHTDWKTLRTEVALLTVGDASIACIPGEIYPEIVNGGIERAPGGDYPVDPVEVPPIRSFMPGKTKFIFGLANDEIGYIIPKSEWDRDPPYLYHAERRPYGEINSVGPDAAGILHRALRDLSTGRR